MRTVEDILADLRSLAAKAAQGQDVSPQTQEIQQELAAHGIQVQRAQPQPQQRGGSRFAGPGASDDVVQHLAAGGSFQGTDVLDAKGQKVGQVAPQRGGGSSQATTLAGAMQKALAEATPSAGGVLVPPEVSSEVVTIIRNRSAIMLMGPTIVPVAKELQIPRFSTGVAAQYTAENARLPVSEPTFDIDPLLRPKELGVLLPVSNRLLRDAQTVPELDQVLRNELGESMASRQDLAFLQGTGTGEEPLGIRNAGDLTPAPDLGANGGTPTFDNLKDMVAGVRMVNAPFLRPGWVFNPRTINTLEKIKDGEGRYLAEAGLLEFDATGGGGKLLGFPFRTSGNIPTTLERGTSDDASYIVFSSDWQEAFVGENLDLEIDASVDATYSADGGTTHSSAWQMRQTVFRAISAHDIALRRPQFFTVMEGVRP